MLPNIDDSVASLRRLIIDAKDRTRALQKLAEAEQAQKKHATDVGVPFNAEAFLKRRAELAALPKVLTVEGGQLTSFIALQRAIDVIVGGPYVREPRRGANAAKQAPARVATSRVASTRGAKQVQQRAGKQAVKRAGKQAVRRTSSSAKQGAQNRGVKRGAKSASPVVKHKTLAAPRPTAREPIHKPLPLALGS